MAAELSMPTEYLLRNTFKAPRLFYESLPENELEIDKMAQRFVNYALRHTILDRNVGPTIGRPIYDMCKILEEGSVTIKFIPNISQIGKIYGHEYIEAHTIPKYSVQDGAPYFAELKKKYLFIPRAFLAETTDEHPIDALILLIMAGSKMRDGYFNMTEHAHQRAIYMALCMIEIARREKSRFESKLYAPTEEVNEFIGDFYLSNEPNSLYYSDRWSLDDLENDLCGAPNDPFTEMINDLDFTGI